MRSLMVLLALATTAEAQLFRRTCRQCVPAAQVVVQQAVPVVAAPVAFVLAPQSQPSSYGAAQYRPPLRDAARASNANSPRAASGSSQEISLLVAAIEKLVGRVDALEGKFGTQAGDSQIPQIVSQQCGKCHGDNGGESGITFADIATTANDKAQLSVMKGSMPKRGDEAEPIEPEVRKALVAALESMKR